MFKDALSKLFEAAISVVPISLIVIVIFGLQFSEVMPSGMISTNMLVTFLICLIFLILGMATFSFGSEISMSKVGQYIGASITKKQSIVFMIVISFLLGTMITIAEPDLTVLGDMLESAINPWLLKIFIGVGVGIFLVIGLLRIVFQQNLKMWLLFFYFIIFGLGCFLDGKNGEAIISIAFDSGGVTTGPVTVPFLLTFGAGVAAVRGGKNASSDSFGITGICSIGPLVTTMLLFLIASNFIDFTDFKNTIDSNSLLGEVISSVCLEVLLAVAPLFIFFLVYQAIFIKLPLKELLKIILGFVYTYIGLAVFVSAAKYGLIPVSYTLGTNLGDPVHGGQYSYLLIILAIFIGCAVVLVEPGVHILNKQVEEVSGGTISKNKMLITLCLGVAMSVVLEVVREVYGHFSIIYYYVPIYMLSMGLSFVVPDIYTAIAFDSGGVASGTMSSCFVLPFIMGIASIIGENSGFGVIGLLSAMPIICIQLLGLESTIKIHLRYREVRKKVRETNDCQIIHL